MQQPRTQDDITFQKAVKLHQSGQTAAAEAIYTKILAARPDHPGALHMLGVLRQQQRRHAEALDLIGRAVARNPANHVYHNNYGAVLHSIGGHQDAAAEFAQALALSPNYADALANQGMAMMSLRHDAAALASLRRALELQPAHGDALRRAAAMLKKYGRAGEAVALFERAIALTPGPRSLPNPALSPGPSPGKRGEASALTAAPSLCSPLPAPSSLPAARTHVDFGELLVGPGSRDRAIEQYRRALELSPDLAEAHVDLGAALTAQGKVEEAEGHLRRAVELRPDSAAMHSNWVYCQQYREGVTPEALAAAHAEWDRRHGAPLRSKWQAFEKALTPGPSPSGRGEAEPPGPSPGRRGEIEIPGPSLGSPLSAPSSLQRPLRLGFVSRHFRQHPVGCMTVRAIECLKERRPHPGPLPEAEGEHRAERDEYFARISAERDEYVGADGMPSPPAPLPEGEGRSRPLPGPLPVGEGEIYCYSDAPRRDAITERFIAAADCWRDTDKLSDDALAEQIRRDRIDILFDLGGHLGGNRLLLFARKPAPVQIKWVGYPGSGGLAAMDYLLADRFHVPPGDEGYCPEKVLRLPDGYICSDPPAEAPEYVGMAVRLAHDLPRLAKCRGELRPRLAGSPLCDGRRFSENMLLALRCIWHERKMGKPRSGNEWGGKM